MAMIDYGAIAFKNGEQLNHEMFMDMKKSVGWSNKDLEGQDYVRIYGDINLDRNYFCYIGDSEKTLAFYRGKMTWVEKYEDVENACFYAGSQDFYCTDFKWKKWRKLFDYDSECIVTKRNGYFVCKWTYKGDKYKVYFGYGVDVECYNKYHVVNYYRSIPYFLSRL